MILWFGKTVSITVRRITIGVQIEKWSKVEKTRDSIGRCRDLEGNMLWTVKQSESIVSKGASTQRTACLPATP
jgi:hypothetical protein